MSISIRQGTPASRAQLWFYRSESASPGTRNYNAITARSAGPPWRTGMQRLPSVPVWSSTPAAASTCKNFCATLARQRRHPKGTAPGIEAAHMTEYVPTRHQPDLYTIELDWDDWLESIHFFRKIDWVDSFFSKWVDWWLSQFVFIECVTESIDILLTGLI